MKRKGKRFYVEDNTKKAKINTKNQLSQMFENTDNTNAEFVPHTGQADSDTRVFSTDKELSKREIRMKKQVAKKLEKSRNKANKQTIKDEPQTTVEHKAAQQEAVAENSKVLDFKSYKEIKHKESLFSRLRLSASQNKKTLFLCAIIVLVLCISVLIFSYRDRLSFSSIKNWVEYGVLNMNSEEVFPVSTDSDIINQGNFSRIDRNLVYASDTRFATLNNYGRTIYSNAQAYSNPVLAQGDDSDLSLVYNLGGTGFSIYNLDSTVFMGEAQDNIVVADISKSGTYAIVTTKDGYLSKLYVYSKDHKQIFAYSFADYYITSVSLDSKGKSAVLTGISAHDGVQISAVYVLSFTKSEPVVFEEFENNVLYHVQHLSNNNVCVIGDSSCYTLNLFSKSFNETSYEGKTLTAFDVNTDTNTFALSLSRSGDGRKCDVLVFSTTGSLRSTITTELMITSLSTYKNRVAALSSGEVYLYTKDGSLLSTTPAGLDPHAVELYSTNDAYILGVSEIRRLDL